MIIILIMIIIIMIMMIIIMMIIIIIITSDRTQAAKAWRWQPAGTGSTQGPLASVRFRMKYHERTRKYPY